MNYNLLLFRIHFETDPQTRKEIAGIGIILTLFEYLEEFFEIQIRWAGRGCACGLPRIRARMRFWAP